MKTKLRRISKRSLSMFLAIHMMMSIMVVGTISASAALSVAGYIYFIKPSDWTYAALMIGHSSYSDAYQMSNISGTNLYYVNRSSAWSDSTEFAFFDVNGWGSEGNSISHRAQYADHSSTINSSYAMNAGSTYLITSTSNSPTYYSSGYSALNKTLTVKTMLYSGSAYAETTTACGTYAATNAKKMNGNGSSTSSSFSNSNGTGTLSTARTNTATISQTAATGYTFQGWKTSKDTTGSSLTTGNYSFTNSGSATTIYAYYKRTTYTVTYNKGSNGTGTNTTDTKTHGTALTLKGAIFTRTGYTQTAWNTNSSGTGGTSYALNGSYTANAAVTLYPTWTKNSYNLSFSQPSNGSIKYNSSTTSPVAIEHGSSVSVVVTPNDGYKISSLTDNNSAVSAAAGETSAYTYTISSFTAAHDIAATMAKRSYSISYTGSNVSYSSKPTSGTYGNQVSFSVSATGSYVLGEVTGTYQDKNGATQTLNISGSNGSYSFTQPAGNVSINISTILAPKTVTVTKGTGIDSYVVNGNTYTDSSRDFTVSSGDSFTITTVNYSTGYENNNNTLSIASVTSDQTIALTAKKTSYTITKATATNGSFTVKKSGTEVTSANYGDTITITPTANTNYTVDTVKYNDGSDHTITASGGTYSFTMPAHDVTITVTFKEAKYTVTVQSESTTKGTVALSSVSAGNVNWVTLPAATPKAGYVFNKWEITTNSGNGTLNNATSATQGAIKATGACTVTAKFTEIMNTITVAPEYCGSEPLGTVNPVSGSAGVATSLNVSATARTGYAFLNWTGENLTFADADSASTSLNASAASTATANYKPTKLYLDISGNTSWRNQTIKIYFWNGSNYREGVSSESVTMTAVAGENDLFVGDIPTGFYENTSGNWGFIFYYGDWTKQTGDLQFSGKKNRYAVTSTLISGESKKYTGSWDDDAFILETKYDVTINSGAGGTVTFNTTTEIAANSSETVQVGATARSLVATPQAGYHFTGWTKTGGAALGSTSNASTTISASATGTVTASFAQDVYTVSLSGSNCTLNTYSNSGMTTTKTQFNYNDTVYYKLTPASGYRITSIKIGDGTATTETDTGEKSGSFTITGNTTITVTTVQIYTVTLSTSANGFGSTKQYKLGSSGTYVTYSEALIVDAGTEVYFKVTYATGYKYKSSSLTNATFVTNYTEFKTSAISADTTVSITATKKTYTLSGAVSPSHGTVTFYKESACTTPITSVAYLTYFYAKYTPADGYSLKNFTTSDANISATTGNVATCRVTSSYANKTTVTITANVALEHTVTYYVDMHTDSTVESIGLYSNSTATTALQYNNNGTLTNCIGTASQQGTSTVYAAEIRTPLTSSGSGFSPIYVKITYRLAGASSSTSKIVTLNSANLTTVNTNTDKSVWMEAVSDSQQDLSIVYSTNSSSTVASGYQRIYLKKPYDWQNTTEGQKWTNIGVYYWGDNPTDIGWTNGIKMKYLGYDSSSEYHYYYADIPTTIVESSDSESKSYTVKNIIFQGWGSNTSVSQNSDIVAQTENIMNFTKNYFTLENNNNVITGVPAESNALVPGYTRYASSVTVQKGETQTINIKPTTSNTSIAYSSNATGVATVSTSGVVTPIARGTATITVKVYGTVGNLVKSHEQTDKDYRQYSVTVNVKDPSVVSSFSIMSLATRTSTITIPMVGSTQPGYFDSAPSVAVTGTPNAPTAGYTNSAIVSPSDNAVTGNGVSGTKYKTYTVKYAAPSTFSGYTGITVTAKEITSKSIHYNDAARYGYDHWEKGGTTQSYTVTKSVTDGVETAVTKNITLDGSTFSEVFDTYTYVDVTFNFDYYEYETERTVQKLDAEGHPIPSTYDAQGNVTSYETEKKNFYYYDPTWIGNDDSRAKADTEKASAAGLVHYVPKTYTVADFEVRLESGQNSSNVNASNIYDDAADAIGNKPDNNYYNYQITSSTIKNITTNGTYKATVKVEMTHSPKVYTVSKNGSNVANSSSDYASYHTADSTTGKYYYQEYANLTDSNTVDWKLATTNEILYTGKSYKFRVTGNTSLITATASDISGNKFNRAKVALTNQETQYEHKVANDDSTPIVEKLTNNFYIADFFDPAKVLNERNLPEDDVTFVGGGVVYYQVANGVPAQKPVDGGYVNGDSSSQNYGLADADAVKEFLREKIEAALDNSTLVPNDIEGDDDRMAIAYGTEIPATADSDSGLRYRYLPYEIYDRNDPVGSNPYGTLKTQTVDGVTSYTFATNRSDNTFRYSNALKAYQYIYADKRENKAANEGKDMRLYAYYIYSYTEYDKDSGIPHTEYKVVLSDQPTNASTYFYSSN
ncbi:MAG: InlB B-repeat-containing protein [Ruminococcus sp.]|nr:InlB B-repeat-containing protein [Ruminococcus sp.]